jgi:hypothetical protein
MTRNAIGVVAVVALVALAGCTGFAPGAAPGTTPTDDAPETDEPSGVTDDAEATTDSGVVRFYISDERNAIGDFEHLNVTISEVGFRTAGDDAEDGEQTDSPENETETEPENETETPGENETEVPEDDPDANETELPDNETEVHEGDETDDEGEEADEEESGEWVEHEVEDRTFDLTRLQGDNASLLGEFEAPAGSYDKVFVHVEEINATLENGESVNVKLPSEKLRINEEFTVGANESADFVFDITVFEAGNSGKYVLKPVISESGTDAPIQDVDEDRDGENREEGSDDEREDEREDDEGEDEEDEREDDERDGEDVESTIEATFVGPVEPGENATVRVSTNGSAVANATVTVNDEVVGVTGDAGQLTFAVPDDVEELDVEIEAGDAEAELEVEFEEAPPA